MPAHKEGFTLVELLVVISIIAILSVIGITIYTSTQTSARDARRRGDLHAIALALEQYKSVNGSYPATTTWSSHINAVNHGWTDLGTALAPYIQTMPIDPQNIDLGGCQDVTCHMYHICSDGTYFVLMTNLENPPSTTQANPPDCSINVVNRYWIRNQQ